MKMKRQIQTLAGLAFALVLAPASAKAVEVYKADNALVDIGMRYQVQGVFENIPSNDFAAVTYTVKPADGRGARDYTRIYLFQPENRLKMTADLEGIHFKFEDAFGSEAYAGSNNLYDLLEMDGEFPVTENLSVVAGLSKMPDNNASATYEENMMFTSHSQLFNLFFNKGYDTAVFAKYRVGLVDAVFGTEQGAPNLPQRYIPERLEMPVPVFLRIGAGNITDDPTRFKQIGFAKSDGVQWAAHANGYWLSDSNAGHGTLFSQMSTQADAPKGPFVNGNEMFSKNFNPFLNAGASANGTSLGPVNNQYWQASLDGQLRVPMSGDKWLIGGAEWAVSQFIAANIAGSAMSVDGSNYGQLTAQGGEAYLGVDADRWFVATRLDVLLPDPMMEIKGAPGALSANGGTQIGGQWQSIFGSSPIYELTFPSLGWKFNKYSKLVCELEHNLNATTAVDTDGSYDLKSVPVEASLACFDHIAYMMTGRMMFQVAF